MDICDVIFLWWLISYYSRLMRMWKSMLECHRRQCHAIAEAKRLDAIASRKHFTDAHLEATLQLEHELLNWTLSYSCWVGAQKGFVSRNPPEKIGSLPISGSPRKSLQESTSLIGYSH